MTEEEDGDTRTPLRRMTDVEEPCCSCLLSLWIKKASLMLSTVAEACHCDMPPWQAMTKVAVAAVASSARGARTRCGWYRQVRRSRF